MNEEADLFGYWTLEIICKKMLYRLSIEIIRLSAQTKLYKHSRDVITQTGPAAEGGKKLLPSLVV